MKELTISETLNDVYNGALNASAKLVSSVSHGYTALRTMICE